MKHDTHDTHDATELPDALRWQLRALRQDQPPTTDLWPGIAQRLTPQSGDTVSTGWGGQPTATAARQRSRMPVALAASVLVAVGTLGLLRVGGPAPGQSSSFADDAGFPSTPDTARLSATPRAAGNAPPISADTPLALAEAQALRMQYQGAIRELETRPGAAAANPTLRTLDQSAELILAALRQAPDSTRLLEQLRRTYQRRLDLMRLPLA